MKKSKLKKMSVGVDEKLRLKLLKEEQRLRKKQPQPWTKQKYRKWALGSKNPLK